MQHMTEQRDHVRCAAHVDDDQRNSSCSDINIMIECCHVRHDTTHQVCDRHLCHVSDDVSRFVDEVFTSELSTRWSAIDDDVDVK